MTKLVDVHGDYVVANWRDGDAKNILLEDIAPKAAAYLLQYGLNKTTQDCVSGHQARLEDLYDMSKAAPTPFAAADGKVNDKAIKEWAKACEDAGVARDHTKDKAEWVDMVLSARKEARLADVMAGKLEPPTGSVRLTGIDRLITDIADERLRAAMAKANVKMPKDEAYDRAIAHMLSKYGEEIRAAAQRRIDEAKDSAKEVDDDLLAAMRGEAPKAEEGQQAAAA